MPTAIEEYGAIQLPSRTSVIYAVTKALREQIRPQDPTKFTQALMQKIAERVADKYEAYKPVVLVDVVNALGEFMSDEEAQAMVELDRRFPGIFQRQRAASDRVTLATQDEMNRLTSEGLEEVLAEEGLA